MFGAPTIEERIVTLHAQMQALHAEWLALVAEYDTSGAWQAKYLSAAAGVRDLCRMNPGHAAADVKLSRKLSRLDETRTALATGEISRAHVEVIAGAYTPDREGELAPLENEFVNAARALEPRALRNVVRYATDAIDGDDGAGEDERVHARRRWHMSRTIDDMLKIDALVDPEAAEYWEKAILAEMDREQSAEDPRTLAQWRADAATNIVRRALDQGEVGSRRKALPHLSTVVDLRERPGATAELIDAIRAERRSYGRLSRATLERIACDCQITRILMNGPSEILDVGRTTRTVTTAQWRALVARDGGCVSCGASPDRCEAHHRRPWSHGGPTDLDNLELRCKRCHRAVHQPSREHDDRQSPVPARGRSRPAGTSDDVAAPEPSSENSRPSGEHNQSPPDSSQ